MLMPWRVQTERDRAQLLRALDQSSSRVLVPADGDVAQLTRRVAHQTDPDQDVWLATGRIEHPLSLFSLLHARLETGGNEAVIDGLAVTRADQWRGRRGFVGFGELLLLSSLLAQRGIARLRLPLEVDLEASGLAAAGWREAEAGVYTRASG